MGFDQEDPAPLAACDANRSPSSTWTRGCKWSSGCSMAVKPGRSGVERCDDDRQDLRDADTHVGNPDRQPRSWS